VLVAGNLEYLIAQVASAFLFYNRILTYCISLLLLCIRIVGVFFEVLVESRHFAPVILIW